MVNLKIITLIILGLSFPLYEIIFHRKLYRAITTKEDKVKYFIKGAGAYALYILTLYLVLRLFG